MSSINCVYTPTIKGKKSKLYEALLDKTGRKNRKVANLLYAISNIPAMKQQFNKDDFDSLGEIKYSAFAKKIDIDGFLSSEDQINSYKRELGTVDRFGNNIEFTNPMQIAEKVVDFNKNHNNVAATINYSNNKFTVDISNISSESYDSAYRYEKQLAKWKVFNQYLSSFGLDTDYSDKTSSFANLLTTDNIINWLTDCKTKIRKSESIYLDENRVNLLKDWFSTDPFITNAKAQLDDDTLSKLLLADYYNITREDIDKEYWIRAARLFLTRVENRLMNVQVQEMKDALQSVESSVKNNNNVLGQDKKEIKEVMDDLNERFHLDTDFEETNNHITSLKDAANKIFANSLKRLQLMQGNPKTTQEQYEKAASDIKNIEEKIEQAKYTASVADGLRDISNELKTLMNGQNLFKVKSSDDPFTLLKYKASWIWRAIQFIQANKDVVQMLTHPEDLSNEDFDVSPELIDEVKSIAQEVNESIIKLDDFIKEKQFSTVYDFLRMYWGDSDVKEFDSKKYSLQELLYSAPKDSNILERFFLSMNTASDSVLGLIHQAVLQQNRKRDKMLEQVMFHIRDVTDKLYKSGSDSKFMFEFDENGVATGNLMSNVDWVKWKSDIQKFKESLEKRGYDKQYIQRQVNKFRASRLKNQKLFGGSAQFQTILKTLVKDIYGSDNIDDFYEDLLLPDLNLYGNNNLDKLTQPQREYYYTMMALKMLMSRNLPLSDISIFKAVQVSGNNLNRMENAGSVFEFIKEQFKDLGSREDDTEYLDDFIDMLNGNDVKIALSDANNHIYSKLPVFYIRELADKRRLSTNMSYAMTAFVAGALQHDTMDEIFDLLMVTEDLLINHRDISADSGGKRLVDLFNFNGKTYVSNIVKKQGNTTSAGLLEDFYERNVFSRKKKTEKTVHIFGTDVSLGKAADKLTAYTSFTGLAPNILGAEANYLVGKLQMVIEGSCGEFFNMKNYAVGELKYFQMLPSLLNELSSNNKKSKLALLGNYFNVSGDYFEKAKEKGFEKKAIKRILSNPNLMFMYGMGEHALHYQTMLACMDAIKVRNKTTGIESSILDVFDVEFNEDKTNGKLKINYNDYELVEKKGGKEKEEKTYRSLTEQDILDLEKTIKYCNDTMHGAFSDIDKGMIHRYAFGRLFMNFRQWMPAHYGRRFQGLHYDADLGQMRRGYYVSTFKFLKDCLSNPKKLIFNLRTNWNELSDMDKYNIKRAIAEITLLAMLCAEIASLGTYKDKKGNWAYRNLQYELRRMRMETLAATPTPFIITEMINILNSPMASIKTLNGAAKLLNLTNLFKEVEGGKHKGENKWVYDLEKNAPVYNKLHSQLIDFSTEDYIFNVFN